MIHIIPKGKPNSIDPLQYRGLALQSCVYKILSSILNSRIMKLFDKYDVLEDEQNGFHKERSCLHHIFALSMIVKNKNEIFSAFIDF